jgi:hypothetical protein
MDRHARHLSAGDSSGSAFHLTERCCWRGVRRHRCLRFPPSLTSIMVCARCTPRSRTSFVRQHHQHSREPAVEYCSNTRRGCGIRSRLRRAHLDVSRPYRQRHTERAHDAGDACDEWTGWRTAPVPGRATGACTSCCLTKALLLAGCAAASEVALRTVMHEHHGMRSSGPRSRTPIR